MMNNNAFSGTGVAIVTPFNPDGTIDYASLQKLILHINPHVDYIVVMGTTGENPVLNSQEKLDVIKAVIEYNQSKIPIVVGIGGYSTQEVIENTHKYSISGVSGLLSVTPYYNKPSQQGLYQHFLETAKVTKLPIILYNVPGRTGCNMLPETTLRLANDCQNIIGIKEASGNVEQIMQIIAHKPDSFLVISGDDALTLPLIAAGADGVISVTANALPDLVNKMVHAAMDFNYNLSREIHYKILPFTQLLFKEGSPAGIKTALSLMTICQNYVRLPLATGSEKLNNEISDTLKSLHIL